MTVSVSLRTQVAAALAMAVAILWCTVHPTIARADGTYFNLASGTFRQDWTNVDLITTDDDWSGVPSIIGYRGDNLTSGTGTNPGMLTANDTGLVVDVNANQTSPNTFNTGGVTEFHLPNPTVALAGSGTATAPYLQIHLNAAGRKNIRVWYTLRDLETGSDNAVQQVALQYRTGTTAPWVNIPEAYVPDATVANASKADTLVRVTLPDGANDARILQLRIITTNAPGNDEWVGVDDIEVSSDSCDGPCPTPVVNPPVISYLHEIQGAGRRSPLLGQVVKTQGIVTARARNGFFLQSPAAEADADPLTSQGLFVFTSSTPPAIAAVGDTIQVTGTVDEFGSLGGDAEDAPTVTELRNPTGYVQLADGTLNDLPAPVALTAADLSPSVPFDHLERYEGMRVTVPETVVVGPTKSRVSGSTLFGDGQFYVTLPSVARPYREPGIEAHVQLATNEPAVLQPASPSVPRFDTNPEVLRIDTDELFALGSGTRTPGVNAAVGATVSSFTGVLHYEDRTYSAMPTVTTAADVNRLLTNNVIRPVQPLSAPTSSQFTVGSANLENFTKDGTDYPSRKVKIVRAVCDILRAPDILGVIEVDDISTLNDLVSGSVGSTTNLNNYSGCGGATYSAYLDSPDNGSQNTGFLVKTSTGTAPRVTVLSTRRADTPEGGIASSVNDRRPYVLSAAVQGAAEAVPVTVIVNHLKSLIGVDDPLDPNTREKKKNQAQYLAYLVRRLQTEDPSINLALVGDFNSFEFSEGYVDVLGTVRGAPEPDDAKTYVTGDNLDIFDPDLVDIVTLQQFPAAERFTYSYLGDRQVLDHVLVNQNLLRKLRNFAIAYVNSEYPELNPSTGTSLRSDPARPERYSDHDAPLGYFGLATARDVSSQVQVTSSGLVYNRATGTYSGSITVLNQAAATVAGPLHVVLSGISAGITVVNAAGIVAEGPYLSSSAGSLAAGASVVFNVQLRNTSAAPPAYTPITYAGAF